MLNGNLESHGDPTGKLSFVLRSTECRFRFPKSHRRRNSQSCSKFRGGHSGSFAIPVISNEDHSSEAEEKILIKSDELQDIKLPYSIAVNSENGSGDAILPSSPVISLIDFMIGNQETSSFCGPVPA